LPPDDHSKIDKGDWMLIISVMAAALVAVVITAWCLA
jgi:hypothetical protein